MNTTNQSDPSSPSPTDSQVQTPSIHDVDPVFGDHRPAQPTAEEIKSWPADTAADQTAPASSQRPSLPVSVVAGALIVVLIVVIGYLLLR